MGSDPGGSYERFDGGVWEPSTKPNSAFSPPAIALVAVIACTFLIVTYYRYLLKYCRLPWRIRSDEHEYVVNDSDGLQISTSQNFGLEEAVMKRLPVYVFRKENDLFIEGTECAVCLLEFEENESLRILPKCSHAFHINCIDMWLGSHANCPLCRSNVVASDHSLTLPPPPAPSPAIELAVTDSVVISVEEVTEAHENHVVENNELHEVKRFANLGHNTSLEEEVSESTLCDHHEMLNMDSNNSYSKHRGVSPYLVSREPWNALAMVVISPSYHSRSVVAGESTSTDRINIGEALQRSYRLERLSPLCIKTSSRLRSGDPEALLSPHRFAK